MNGVPGGGEGLSIAWWKYTNDRGFSAAPGTGMLPLWDGSGVEDFHSVVFYEAAASGIGGPVPSAAVADSKHLTIFRIRSDYPHTLHSLIFSFTVLILRTLMEEHAQHCIPTWPHASQSLPSLLPALRLRSLTFRIRMEA